MTTKTMLTAATLGLLLAAAPALAQAPSRAAPAGGKTSDAEILEAPDDPGVRKTFSREEVRRLCTKFEGQLIAYYGDVWKVERCERRPIMANKTVYELQRAGKQVNDVDGDTVAAIPEGEPLDLAMSIEAARGCRQLEGRYVTYSSVDVYIVERCKKRLFPDWASYIRHREQRTDKKGEILALSWIEFDRLAAGQDVPSVIDDAFAKALAGETGVDVLPVDEACQGLNGKTVSYYSRLYRIERCRKRELLVPSVQLRGEGLGDRKVQELTSQQWLSLPDGEPIQSPRPRGDGGTAAR